MKEKKSNRTRIIGLRLTADEFDKIEKKWKSSTCRKLSDYVRRRLFDKAIVKTYRNLSMDQMMAEMSLLRTELNRIGNNFNQSVKRLHTLNQISEFKTWLLTYEVEKKTLANKMDEIKNHIQKMAEKWLQ